MPEDEICLETSTQIVRMVNVGKPRAIEPTSIDKAPAAYKFGWNHASAMPEVTTYTPEEFYQPYAGKRKYTANPATCIHHRKRFKTRWVCSDCGTDL